MPDEQEGQSPSGNSNSQSLTLNPATPLPEEGIVAKDGAPNPQQNAGDSQKFANDIHWITHATFWSQIGLGLIGIAALWIYSGQLDEMRKATVASTQATQLTSDALNYSTSQFDRSQQQTITQTLASIEAANAAKSAAKIARDSLVSVQRAFLSPQSKIVPVYADDKNTLAGLNISVVWSNSGTTPTRSTTQHFNGAIYGPEGLPKDFDFSDIWSSGIPKSNINVYVGPKDQDESSPEFIPGALVEAIIERKRRFFFWGWSRYYDVFPGTKEHITKFCYELTLEKPPSSTLLYQSVRCEKNNCWDKECKTQ
jgi:hypothetical protein